MPPVSQTFEDFRLGVGDLLDRFEILQMHRRDRGDDRDIGAHQARQRPDLARMIHAEFEDRKARIGGTARQRQRHAPVIVVGGGRGMGEAGARQHERQRFLGRGLADRAGDRDHLAVQSLPRRARQIAQAFQHVLDHQQPRIGCKRCALRRRDHRKSGAVLQRRLDEVMAVAAVARDREKGVARLQRAAVDRNAVHGARQRALQGRRASRRPSPRRSRAATALIALFPPTPRRPHRDR